MSIEQGEIDLGSGHSMDITCWKPDRDLNPQYAHLPDVDRLGALIYHRKPDGSPCWGAIHFAGQVPLEVFPDAKYWTVEKWEPLTLSPSILCTLCGDHGFIREGRWVTA